MNPASRTRGLSNRHIQFIAFGGAIGAGLFLGSGAGIVKAGPSLLVAYAVSGCMVFFIARALGELSLNMPLDGSFTGYAALYFGPWCGFVTGWSYWLCWVLVGMAEITAAGIFAQFWWPTLPQWVTALLVLCALFAVNRLGVRRFGELEFWIALVKVLAIVALIVCGLTVIVLARDVDGQTAGFSNLWRHGGLFPRGVDGFLGVLPIAFFAFGGVELVGLTANDAEDRARALPRAINGVIGRILLFYIGTLAVIMAVFPWDRIDSAQSPFVLVFQKIGLPAAAGVINFVVLTAVVSCCNSGLYATSRVLATLAASRQAPAWLGLKNRHGVPMRALSVSVTAMLGGVGLNYAIPNQAFGLLLTATAILVMWNWMIIAACHLRYRRARAAAVGDGQEPPMFPLPLYPAANLMIIGFIAVIVILMLTVLDMRLPVALGAAWFLGLFVLHAVTGKP